MKKSNISLAIFLVSILLISCSKKLYFGTYDNSIRYLSNEAFIINADSTFKYEYRKGEWSSNNSEGRWLVQGNNIILNSTYKKDGLPITVQAFVNTIITGYQFRFLKFYAPKENAGIWQNLIINDIFRIKITDSVMIVKYPGEIKKFKIEIIGTQLLDDTTGMYKITTQDYILKGNKINEFVLDYPFNGSMLRYQDFDAEKLLIRHKKIYWPAKQLNYNLNKP